MIDFTPAFNHIGEGFGSDKKIKRRFRSGFCNASEGSGVLVAYPSCVKSLQSIVRV